MYYVIICLKRRKEIKKKFDRNDWVPDTMVSSSQKTVRLATALHLNINEVGQQAIYLRPVQNIRNQLYRKTARLRIPSRSHDAIQFCSGIKNNTRAPYRSQY